MAILHIFNPEHDIALASNLANFTAPHAGRQLRADLGFLPVLWAKEGDVVLVENVEHAQKASRRLRRCAGVQFASVPPQEIDGIQVWGWDKALKAQLKRAFAKIRTSCYEGPLVVEWARGEVLRRCASSG